MSIATLGGQLRLPMASVLNSKFPRETMMGQDEVSFPSAEGGTRR